MKKYFSKFSTLHSQLSTPRGFTLVEILIVLAVIAVVGTLFILGVNPLEQLRKSNDAARKSDLSQLQKALELYYQDNGSYPPSSGDFKISIGSATLPWGSPWLPYMKALPKDPTATRTYQYYSPVSSNGQSYYIYASLERGGKDPQACNQGNACNSLVYGAGFPPSTGCGDVCNYGVSSPNVSP